MEKKIKPGLVDILILFFNKTDQTIDCINSFLPSGQNIYVLNNGSDETELSNLQKYYLGNHLVRILDAGCNLGVSGGRNYLIRNTTAPWLFSVDNDITVRSANGWIRCFFELIDRKKDLKIVCPKIFNMHEGKYSEQLCININYPSVTVDTGNFQFSNCFPGGASIVHKSIFEEYGFFDEEMFVGFEDYEYALRAILQYKSPLQVYCFDKIELIHDHRLQKEKSGIKAVRERYRLDKHVESFRHLETKYGVTFNHDWEWWVSRQISQMAPESKLKRLFKRVLKAFDLG